MMFLNKKYVNINRFTMIFLSFIMTFTMCTTSYAAPKKTKKVTKTKSTSLSKKIKSQNKKLQTQKRNLQNTLAVYGNIQNKIDDTEIAIEKIDDKIENLLSQIHILNLRITATHKKILVAQKNLYNANLDVKQEQILYNKRMRSSYINGYGGYLEVLLNAKDMHDFLSRAANIKKIMDYDNKLIKRLKEKKDTVAKRKALLENYKKIQLGYRKQIENKVALQRQYRTKQNVLIENLNKMETKYAAQIKKMRAFVYSTAKQIESLRKKYLASIRKIIKSGNKIHLPFSVDSLVGYAANFIGTPYKWGGTTPSGFDCSGFTKYVYKKFGINLPRTSGEQSRFGTYVSKSNLQPGDLVFFGSPVHHVGIYVGNNCFIESPRRGESVKISPLTRRDFNCGRRVK